MQIRTLLTLTLLAFASAGCGEATKSVAPEVHLARNVVRGPMGVIVMLKSGDPLDIARSHGIEPQFVYRHAIRGFAAPISDVARAGLMSDGRVKIISDDQTFTVSEVWGLDRIDQRTLPLDNVYSPPNSGAGVHAYIVDTGIRYTHTEFQGRASPGFDIDGGNGSDCAGHGTHVSGSLGGITYGVAKAVSLISVKIFPVCDTDASGAQLLAGLDWIAANAIRPSVVNMSLGGPTDAVLDSAIIRLTALGNVVVVAAGNNAADACYYSPSRVASALTVGSSNSSDGRSSFSNFGPCVDVYAPGQDIRSAWNRDDTSSTVLSGTSMASPYAAGVAALILSANPSLSVREVDSIVYARSTKGVIADGRNDNNLLYTGLSDNGNIIPPPPYVPPDMEVPPVAPSNLSVTVLSYLKGKAGARIRFAWSDNSSDETGFQIIGSIDDYWPLANTTSLDATVPLGTWTFRMRAYKGSVDVLTSDWSNSVTITLSSHGGATVQGHK